MYKLIKYLNYNTSLINLIGIHIYLYLYLYYSNIIPLIVYINGVITHSSVKFKYHNLIRIYDIISNIILGIYININTFNQPNTIIVSSIASIFYIIKNIIIKRGIKSQLIHVIFVHIPLAQCLKIYLKT